MTTASVDLDLGTGVYSIPDAAAIVGRSVGHASANQVRYWIREGLSESVVVDRSSLMSFQDLVSLEMIARFRWRGVSLQAIRAADRNLRQRHPDLRRPFANLVFYTDGRNLWTVVGDVDDPQLLEILGRTDQYAWQKAIETFAKEITFTDGTATSWKPTEWVELNPRIQFGEPVVAGTRVPVRTVVANLEAGTPVEVAEWYGLSTEQVVGARKYVDRAE
jgi:uncharacterized protein (DUF433 family)/DNA-binding transcriptional MerR regulator